MVIMIVIMMMNVIKCTKLFILLKKRSLCLVKPVMEVRQQYYRPTWLTYTPRSTETRRET